MSTPARNGPFIIAVSSLFFGLMAVVARLVAGQVPSPQLATIRLTVGAVFCVVVFVIQRRTPPMRRWRALVMRGVFGGIAVVTYFYSIERLGAARGTVLNYTSPIYAALFANWFLHEKSSSAQRLGLIVATIGAALVTLSTAGATAWWVPDIGAVAGIVSAVTAGAAITVIRKLRDDTDALTVFAAFCVFGGFTTAPMAAMSWAPLTWTTFSICVAVGLLSIGGQLLFTWGMGFTSATTGSAVTQLVPLISWLLALVWLGEKATPLGLVGALVCVGGVLLGVIPWRALLERRSGAALPERELPQVLPLKDAGAVKVTKSE